MSKKNKHNEDVGSEVVRSDERIDATGEVFTPVALCAEMVSQIPESILKNDKSIFLDNSAGSGNFLLALQTELLKYHSLSHINDNMLYGVELMEDNHAEMCNKLGVSVDHPHFVCANALEYDYSFGNLVGLEDQLGKITQKQKFTPPAVNNDPSEAKLPL